MATPFWLMKCKNCYWYNKQDEKQGICTFQVMVSDYIVGSNSYCPDWASRKNSKNKMKSKYYTESMTEEERLLARIKRRQEQEEVLTEFIAINPKCDIQINFSVPNTCEHVCITLKGRFAKPIKGIAQKMLAEHIAELKEHYEAITKANGGE